MLPGKKGVKSNYMYFYVGTLDLKKGDQEYLPDQVQVIANEMISCRCKFQVCEHFPDSLKQKMV
jgi:hypothetical protein